MKFVTSILLVTLAGCGTTHYGFKGGEVADDGAKKNCSGTCDAQVTCTPDGNCLITCTDDAGGSCEIELACDGQGGCEVVRTDCSGSSCCAAQSANKPIK